MIEYVESSNRHVIAQPPKAKPSLQNQHSRAKTKSNSGRPCTPAPSLTTSATVSPPSILTVSPISPIRQTQRHRVYSQKSRQRPAALKLCRIPSKQDISPPVPSPIYCTFDDNASYHPRRPAPTTPPLQALSSTSPAADAEAETSYMEWDNESSTISKMRQTLRLAQSKHPGVAPSRASPSPPPPKPKIPYRHDNATPRPLPARNKRPKPPAESVNPCQPLTTSNLSRPKIKPTYTYLPTVSAASPSTKAVFYQGPDLTGKSASQRPKHHCGSWDTPPARQHGQTTSHRSKTTDQQPRAGLPQQIHHGRQQSKSATTDPFSSPAHSYPRLRQPCKIQLQPRYMRRVDVGYGEDSSGPGPFLANEAVPVEPPSPTPTSTKTTAEKQRRIKALMTRLVKRASGRDLKKMREDSARGTSR